MGVSVNSIGQVAKLPDEELRRLIGELSPDIGSQVSLYAALVEDYRAARARALGAARRGGDS